MMYFDSLLFAKLSHLESGDVFDTLGQFHPDGWGAGRYLVRTLDEWRNDPFAELGQLWTVTENRREEVTLANGNVARLICDFSPEHQTVAAYGYNLIGHQRYGAAVNVTFKDDTDVIAQNSGGYDRYHVLTSFPVTVAGNYTAEDKNPYTGRVFLKKERGTWREPLRLGDLRIWMCSEENLHFIVGKEPESPHDGGAFFTPSDRGTVVIPATGNEFV